MTEVERLGRVLCVSGPSGVGKGTVIDRFREAHPEVWISVSKTTRAPRPGDVHGVDYLFVDRAQFEAEIAAGLFIESDCYCDNYYGTPLAPILAKREAGVDVALDITVLGAMTLREKLPEAVLVFLLPPDRKTLKARLDGRGSEKEAVRKLRVAKAEDELVHAPSFDYVLVNEDLEETAAAMQAILMTERAQQAEDIAALRKRFACPENLHAHLR